VRAGAVHPSILTCVSSEQARGPIEAAMGREPYDVSPTPRVDLPVWGEFADQGQQVYGSEH
jgi:hypothetical protein